MIILIGVVFGFLRTIWREQAPRLDVSDWIIFIIVLGWLCFHLKTAPEIAAATGLVLCVAVARRWIGAIT